MNAVYNHVFKHNSCDRATERRETGQIKNRTCKGDWNTDGCTQLFSILQRWLRASKLWLSSSLKYDTKRKTKTGLNLETCRSVGERGDDSETQRENRKAWKLRVRNVGDTPRRKWQEVSHGTSDTERNGKRAKRRSCPPLQTAHLQLPPAHQTQHRPTELLHRPRSDALTLPSSTQGKAVRFSDTDQKSFWRASTHFYHRVTVLSSSDSFSMSAPAALKPRHSPMRHVAYTNRMKDKQKNMSLPLSV